MFKQAANPDAEYPPMRFFNLSTEEEYHEIYAAYEHLAHKRKWPMESAYDKLLTRLMGEHATALEELSARATKAESRVVELLSEFSAGIQPADIPACLEAHSEPAFGEFLRGANSVHATNLRWVRWKAAELGISWPLPHAEFEFGYTPDACPTPLPSSPAAAGPGKSKFCQCSFAMIMRGENDLPYCAQCRRLIEEEIPAGAGAATTGEGKSDE